MAVCPRAGLRTHASVPAVLTVPRGRAPCALATFAHRASARSLARSPLRARARARCARARLNFVRAVYMLSSPPRTVSACRHGCRALAHLACWQLPCHRRALLALSLL
eukprot:4405926-Pleurochrysis_carterae.AAC.1